MKLENRLTEHVNPEQHHNSKNINGVFQSQYVHYLQILNYSSRLKVRYSDTCLRAGLLGGKPFSPSSLNIKIDKVAVSGFESAL